MLTFVYTSIGQDLSERDVNFGGVGFSYGINFPGGDMADRFGSHFHAGLSFDFYNIKLNGTITLEGGIMFGDNVKEDVLAPYRLSNGRLLGNNGSYAEVFLRQRGTYIGAFIDKIILARKSNKTAGLSLGFGAGILQHKIRVQDELGSIGQLSGDYIKGYDRNTMGPYLKQALRYLNIGKSKNINYAVGLSITEGFTKNTRKINFDTQQADNGRRLDLLISIELKWYLPIYDLREPEEIFY